MKIYERNIEGKIWILRFILVLMLSVGLLFFKAGFHDAGFVSITLLMLSTIVPVSDLQIYTDRLVISQYYCFGLFARRRIFEKNEDILLSSFELVLDGPEIFEAPSEVPFWAQLFFVRGSTTTIKKFILRQTAPDGKVRIARLRLSELEYDLVHQYFHPIQPTDELV